MHFFLFGTGINPTLSMSSSINYKAETHFFSEELHGSWSMPITYHFWNLQFRIFLYQDNNSVALLLLIIPSEGKSEQKEKMTLKAHFVDVVLNLR